VTQGTVIPLRPGLEPPPAPGSVNAALVEELASLLDKARAGEVVGIAYAVLHPGDLSSFNTAGRTTRGLLGALTMLQYDMCKYRDAE
jgi:hypothetical protein